MICNKSTKSNAQFILIKNIYYLDIKISLNQLISVCKSDAFKSLGFRDDIASELATICTLEDRFCARLSN
jgi:hypothetical protein